MCLDVPVHTLRDVRSCSYRRLYIEPGYMYAGTSCPDEASAHAVCPGLCVVYPTQAWLAIDSFPSKEIA